MKTAVMKKALMLLTLAFMFTIGRAVATPVDTYQFKSEVNQKRGIALARSMRCPQCQNQDLVDSNSPVAHDLRLQVYKMVDEGRSDSEIINYMTQRYGDFVLYNPRLDGKTYLLWWGPLGLLIVGAIVVGLFVRQQRSKREDKPASLSADEQAQLDELLSGKTETHEKDS
ncbi:heme lyase NrfEFG subunit NrfF [Shewanella sp. 202IG2-18]|uniref:heme lyase NrfEFG subunit NrfF n=1 Tax=Parashewanella hymeniacidonis TaxID=2807618 RepID=UPI00196128EF|nr:heme lyase NrfEFG subunit NrfF [Parashewanella hymeniacidonis]MBM7072981.1 heme lyase NrfEFG subunit NrfF [Parashewanella hymeniacidonis]